MVLIVWCRLHGTGQHRCHMDVPSGPLSHLDVPSQEETEESHSPTHTDARFDFEDLTR